MRFSTTSEYSGTSYYVPGNVKLNNIFPYNDGMFQSINLFDWRSYEKFLSWILHEVYNTYYPNSPYLSSVVMKRDTSSNKESQAYTIANEKDNWFSNDTINPKIVFLLDDNGKFMHPGVRGDLFDILSTIDHEYIYFKPVVHLA